jgi:hypothetical protein
MTTPRRNRRLDTVSDRVYRASVNTEAAFEHLNTQRSLVGTGGTGQQERRSIGGHSDPTLRLVQQLDGINYRRTAIDDQIVCIEKAMDLLDEAIRDAWKARALRDDVDEAPATDDRPLCRGGQPDTWGDPTCGAHVEHFRRDDGTIGFRSEGLCSKHRSAKRRWEQNQENAA